MQITLGNAGDEGLTAPNKEKLQDFLVGGL
jgi:hypothetical protein